MKKILEMIETVDPSDTAKLDEIDKLVFEYIKGAGEPENMTDFDRAMWDCRFLMNNYTRSRDALKAIRPKGWFPSIIKNPSGSFYGDDSNGDFPSPALPTEELAELHAIIQAIEYERLQ
jgi:hypothetical protein